MRITQLLCDDPLPIELKRMFLEVVLKSAPWLAFCVAFSAYVMAASNSRMPKSILQNLSCSMKIAMSRKRKRKNDSHNMYLAYLSFEEKTPSRNLTPNVKNRVHMVHIVVVSLDLATNTNYIQQGTNKEERHWVNIVKHLTNIPHMQLLYLQGI